MALAQWKKELIAKKIAQETVANDGELTEESLEKINNAAQKFLEMYNNLNQYKTLKRTDKKQKLRETLKKLEVFLKVLYQELYGREYHYIYVKEDSDGTLFSYKLSLSDLIDYLSIRIDSKGELAIEQGKKFFTDTEGNRKSVANEDFITDKSIDEESQLDKDHVSAIQTVYKHSKNRLERDKAKKHLMFKLHESSKTWYVTTTINFGYLKEAYFNALMREHKSKLDYLCKIQIGDDPYGSEYEMAVFYKRYIQQLDNASFGLTSDVQAVKEIDGQSIYSSYAVKASSFSFGSVKPLANMAKIIKKIANNFNRRTNPNKKKKTAILKQLILSSKTNIHQSIYLYSIQKSEEEIFDIIEKVSGENTFTKLLVANGGKQRYW